jgi:hypothetical protein
MPATPPEIITPTAFARRRRRPEFRDFPRHLRAALILPENLGAGRQLIQTTKGNAAAIRVI